MMMIRCDTTQPLFQRAMCVLFLSDYAEGKSFLNYSTNDVIWRIRLLLSISSLIKCLPFTHKCQSLLRSRGSKTLCKLRARIVITFRSMLPDLRSSSPMCMHPISAIIRVAPKIQWAKHANHWSWRANRMWRLCAHRIPAILRTSMYTKQ